MSRRLASAGLPALLLGTLLFARPAAASEDLAVLFVEKQPAISYLWGSSRPSIAGWPRRNAPVRWIAHVENRADGERIARFRWLVDGKLRSSGQVRLAPGRSTVAWPTRWATKRQWIDFAIDSDDRLLETSETNNSLTFASDAITFGFFVEEAFAAAFRDKAPLATLGLGSVEDWLQAQVLRLNAMAALAVYPETPRGVLDRFRIEWIRIVPDGALPLSSPPGGYQGTRAYLGSRFPDPSDRSVDLQWGFIDEQATWYDGAGWRGYFEHALLHELGHVRYLADAYWWDVGPRFGDRLEMQPRPPTDARGYFHRSSARGLMNDEYGYLDRHSAAALNRIAGHRATRGNYLPPENFAEYLGDLPARNRVRLASADGEPLANARVRLFRSDLGRSYDGIVDQELISDGQGFINLDGNPFDDEPRLRSVEVLVVAVDWRGETLFGFLESLALNLAYWRGERQVATHELMVGPPRCPRVEAPLLGNPTFAAVRAPVTLSWGRVAEAQGYRVYVARAERPAELLAATAETTAELSLQGRVFWWVEAEIADCPPVRSALGVLTVSAP